MERRPLLVVPILMIICGINMSFDDEDTDGHEEDYGHGDAEPSAEDAEQYPVTETTTARLSGQPPRPPPPHGHAGRRRRAAHTGGTTDGDQHSQKCMQVSKWDTNQLEFQ